MLHGSSNWEQFKTFFYKRDKRLQTALKQCDRLKNEHYERFRKELKEKNPNLYARQEVPKRLV